MSKIIAVYVDGGVIYKNPSKIGGTFACRLIFDDGRPPKGYSMALSPLDLRVELVTNNQTEMMAMLFGMYRLPWDWEGTIYSDSAVTIGRILNGFSWHWKNIPDFMQLQYKYHIARFIHWDKIKFVQLDGHPTKKQLACGIGKRGNPVSEHNVWCDEACKKAGDEFWLELKKKQGAI